MKTPLTRISLALAALVILAVLAELATRLVVGERPREKVALIPQHIRKLVNDYGLPFTHKPNTEAFHTYPSDPLGTLGTHEGKPGVFYRINSLGLRGPETTVAKPEGTFRIAMLGDSLTFGGGVAEEDTLPAQLELALRSAAPNTDVRYEVLNFGLPGMNTYLEARYLRRFALDFDPDLVVIGHALDDAGRSKLREWVDQRSVDGLYPAWRNYSVLLDRFAAHHDRERGALRTFEAVRKSYVTGEKSWSRQQRSLRRIVDMASERGASVAMVILPVLYALDPYPLAEVHAEISRSAEAAGVATFDGAAALAGGSAASYWVHPSDPRPNARANRKMAQGLAQLLRERGLAEADASN